MTKSGTTGEDVEAARVATEKDRPVVWVSAEEPGEDDPVRQIDPLPSFVRTDQHKGAISAIMALTGANVTVSAGDEDE